MNSERPTMRSFVSPYSPTAIAPKGYERHQPTFDVADEFGWMSAEAYLFIVKESQELPEVSLKAPETKRSLLNLWDQVVQEESLVALEGGWL